MLVAGVLTQIVAIGQLLKKPLISLDDAAMYPIWIVKIMLFVIGGLTIATSCVGFRFWAKTRRYRTGCCYLLALLITLALQLSLIFVSAAETQAFKDLSDGNTEVFKRAAQLRKKALAKVFESFASRYKKARCSIMRGPGWDTHHNPDLQCEAATVACDEDLANSWLTSKNGMAKLCVPVRGFESKYQEDCMQCQANYYDLFINGSMYEEAHRKELNEYWALASEAFCRCYGRVADILARHLTQLLICVCVWTGLHMLLIFGVIYLMVTAPARIQDWDDDDYDEACEMTPVRRQAWRQP